MIACKEIFTVIALQIKALPVIFVYAVNYGPDETFKVFHIAAEIAVPHLD